jgi:hypothetical protein
MANIANNSKAMTGPNSSLNPTAPPFDVVFTGVLLVPLGFGDGVCEVVLPVEELLVEELPVEELPVEDIVVVAPMTVGLVNGIVVEGKPMPFGPIDMVFPSMTTVVPVAPGGKE